MTQGPLAGVRVVELASEHAAFAGKLMAGLGADVILVEPPGGHHTRWFEPFAHDEPDIEGSLWWWHYNTSKRSVVLDLATDDASRLADLIETADIVLEGEPPGRLRGLGLDHDDLADRFPGVVWVSVTPFGRSGPRSSEQAVDLTVLAAGGPVWSCGYDDHSLPPVRGGGNQGFQIGAVWAVIGALIGVVHRDVSGQGQLVDVSLHAAANVTTELGSYEWLIRQATVQRQTCRHAMTDPTAETFAVAADGREVTTGVPPRSVKEFEALLEWMQDLDLRDEFEDTALLEIGVEHGDLDLGALGEDALVTAIYGAAREAVAFIASHLTAYDFFVQGQRRGLACGVIYAPEEVLTDPHFIARRLPVEVAHGEDTYVYVGAPFRMTDAEWQLRRAPNLGEHNTEVLSPFLPR